MNYPSKKYIAKNLNIDLIKAGIIRKLMQGKINPENFNTVRKWVNECYHRPNDIELILYAINEIFKGYGVEYIEEIEADYINAGDTYIPTVCYHNNRFKIASWGNLMEKYSSWG